MDDGNNFFGGSVTPPPNPVGTHTGEYGDYSVPPASMTPSAVPGPTSGPTGFHIFVVGAVLLLVAVVGFAGYRAFLSHTQIELPDELMGMQRVDPSEPMAQQVEQSWSQLETYFGEDVELHVGTYTRGQEVLIVAAAEAGSSSSTEQDDFFAGLADGAGTEQSGMRFSEVDAGANGGRMQCADMSASGNRAGGCAWISGDTFGVVVVGNSPSDVAQVTRSVRDVIEQ